MSHSVAISVSFVLCATAVADRSAIPGKRAPDLDRVRWIHGEPVAKFETGRVYVLEFWSTWCGACVEPIDHLNELARRHESDVTFVAVHIWQRESAPKPAEFLAGRRTAAKPVWEFSVAEDVDSAIAKTWMDATENGGLPTAMIVDRKSNLAWFGHSKDLDEPLRTIVKRTFDVRRGVAEMNRKIAVGRKASESGQAIEKGNYEQGMTLMLEAFHMDPETVAEWVPSTYGHLLHASQSPTTAATFVRTVLDTEEGRNANLMVGFARMILNFRSSGMCDLNLALELAEKANVMTNSNNPNILSTLATIRAEHNDVVGAIKAIELAMRNVTDDDERDALAKTLEELRMRR